MRIRFINICLTKTLLTVSVYMMTVFLFLKDKHVFF